MFAWLERHTFCRWTRHWWGRGWIELSNGTKVCAACNTIEDL